MKVYILTSKTVGLKKERESRLQQALNMQNIERVKKASKAKQ